MRIPKSDREKSRKLKEALEAEKARSEKNLTDETKRLDKEILDVYTRLKQEQALGNETTAPALALEYERLYSQKFNLKLTKYRGSEKIACELSTLNEKHVYAMTQELRRQIALLRKERSYEEVGAFKKNEVPYIVLKNNFSHIASVSESLLACIKELNWMCNKADLDELEAIFDKAIENIPSEFEFAETEFSRSQFQDIVASIQEDRGGVPGLSNLVAVQLNSRHART